MKLNLLPTYVSQAARVRTAWIFSGLIMLVSIAAAVLSSVYSIQQKTQAKEAADALAPQVEEVRAVSRKAEEIMAGSVVIVSNAQLAKQMNEANAKYPRFYRRVLPYIPSYFRVTDMSVEAQTATTARLVLRGVLQTYQQYADMMLALMRIPGAQSVSREGFVLNDQLVPNLIETDQVGEPMRLTEGRLPSDPFERLQVVIARGTAGTTGFTGVGGFGTLPDQPRGAMPEWSEIVVSVQLQADPAAPPGEALDLDLLVPNPRASLTAIAAAGGAAAAAAGVTTALPGGAMPGTPAGPVPGAAGPVGPRGPQEPMAGELEDRI